MKEIGLSQGKVAFVDDEDYDRVMQFKWFAHSNKKQKTLLYYARHNIYLGKNKKPRNKILHMHRFVLNLTDAAFIIDHIDGNTLNNTKKNLRVCNAAQNSKNLTRKHSKNTSGFRGVYKVRLSNSEKWVARIQDRNGKRGCLGFFDIPEEAARAFDKAAKELYGEFCGKLNFEDSKPKKE